MLNKKDYSKMTLEELISEERKLKSQTIPIALLIGFLIGSAFWSATHHWGFLVTILIMVVALLIGRRSSQTLNDVKNEINRRNSVN